MAGKSIPPAGAKPTQGRDLRLKAALKENLARRKGQARSRAKMTTNKTEDNSDKK